MEFRKVIPKLFNGYIVPVQCAVTELNSQSKERDPKETLPCAGKYIKVASLGEADWNKFVGIHVCTVPYLFNRRFLLRCQIQTTCRLDVLITCPHRTDSLLFADVCPPSNSFYLIEVRG